MSAGDIAVIGMAGRFPGAASITEYWANLREGVESIRRLTDEELLAAGVSQTELNDPAYVKACPVLDGIDQFDASFFGFSPRDASVMDPAHRLFLEVAWEAMEHAGHTALPDEGPVGVFASSGAPYYLMDNVRRNRELMRSMGEFLVRHTNNDMNFLATRVSYEMDLRGPSLNIQTACSSALVSVHVACESIRNGDCVMALAGGSTVNVPARQGYLYQEDEILSPDGHCRPFDEKSDGTVFGSGCGCVVLKKLSTALDDGDCIHAVIKGSAITNDGAQRVGYLAPGVEGQAAVVGRAIEMAQVPAESITYVEAHGTGTRVGDPIEVEALNQAYRARTDKRRFCAIGSVKSNIGHLGEAAGVASLIKAIMALEHRELPPSLGYETPNPQIDFTDSPFFVNDRLRSWEADGPRRCGVTALGAGGTNCHVILEEAPPSLAGEGGRPSQLLVLSAKTPTALAQAAENLADAIADDVSLDLADVAYTLAVGRRTMPHRRVVVARDRAQAVQRLRDRDARPGSPVDDVTSTAVVFMFPGGGAQYPRMGIELFETEPVYRDAVEECLAIIRPILGRDLGALMFADEANAPAAARDLERPSLSLPSLFTTEYAFARLFQSWGVEPTAYLGHSMGEYVAACLSGVMTLREALELVMLRGRLFESIPRGRMLSVSMGEPELRAILPQGLDIAAVNAHRLCVASGPEELIASLEHTLVEREVEHTRVRIDVAAHSAMLEPVLDTFRQFCRSVAWHAPEIPFLSNLTGRWIGAAEATDPEYWVKQLRSTVRFADCLDTLRVRGEPVLVEVGPGRTLTMLARAQKSPARHAMNSMRHPEESASDLDYAIGTLGKAWHAGASVDWTAFYEAQLRNRVPLPAYPWDHQRHWIDAPQGGDAIAGVDARGDLRRESIDDWFERPVWRQGMPAPSLVPVAERVLVFADPTGFGDSVARHLAAAGRHVTRVRAGEAWEQGNADFTIRPSITADYERLLEVLARDGGLPGRVIHAWSVTDPAAMSSLESVTAAGFHSIMCFAQALTEVDPDARLIFDVVTSNVQRVGGEASLQPEKALAMGPTRVMPRELPNVRSRSIDIVLPVSGHLRDALAALIAAEVSAEPIDETVAYRGRDRFVQSLESVRLDRVRSRIRDGGVYLITGGLGGIGYALATHLATQHRARLVLMGRGASAARAADKIVALEALGAQVEVVHADVTNLSQVRAAIATAKSRFGGLHGVFHAAGALGDSLMALKTSDDAERVLAPKVRGTLVLDAALADTTLDLFVLFSSISSIAGLAGQADYTAANAFLDAFGAERNARDGAFTVAVNWSGWRDVGMAANIVSGAGAGAGAGGGGIGEEIHPMVGRRIWATADAELFANDLSVASSWVMSEHRLRGGRSLMPGTGYLEIARAAFESRSEPRAFEIRDMVFMSAFGVQDEAPREMRVHVSRLGSQSQSIVIAGRQTDEDGSPAWQEHVTATVEYVDDAPPSALDIDAIFARCDVREEKFTASQGSANMDFGPRWKNVRSIRYGRDEALVTIELPAAFVGDLETYRLHPALMDMATGRGDVLAGIDPAKDFFVPLSYTRLRMFAPIPARIHSHLRLAPNDFGSSDILVFDVTITDDEGRVLVDIDEFVMTRVTDRSQLEDAAPRGATRRVHANFDPPTTPTTLPPLIQWMQGAIRTDEGMEALDRILSGPALTQVFATPRSVNAMIEELRRPADAVRRATPEASPSVTRFEETERLLDSHPAISRSIVIERFDRTGKRHMVGYVLPRDGETPTVSEIRRFAKKGVDPDRVPGTIILVESFPPDSNGGVDIAGLHDPFGLADDHVAPRSKTEILIAGLWKDALGVERIGIRDNFFDIGGHSLLAVRTVVKLDKAVGVRLNQAVMVLQTLEQIAAEVDRQKATRTASVPSNPTDGDPAADESRGGFLRSIRDAVGGKKAR